MTYGGSDFIKMIQKNNMYIFLLVLGGGQDKPAWTACPPGVKITRVGGKISRDSLSPGGQVNRGWLAPRGASCPGGKINWDTGTDLRYACLFSATLSDMHAGFIYSDTCVCKVLFNQARNLVCYKSTKHVYRLGAAPTGL